MTGRFFEDFSPGDRIEHAVPRTITEGDAALYIALTGERFPIHCAEPLAQKLGYERAPLSDLLVFHMVFGKTVTDISLNAVANLGYAEGRFLRPVYAGDTVSAHSTVLATKENSSGKTGIVWVETVGENQRGDTVLTYKRWVMVHKREPAVPTNRNDKPDLQQTVPAHEIKVPDHVISAEDYAALERAAGQGTRCFEDYEVGETLIHTGGMTIEDSDHMLATRLYQNTAKVHFDGRGMRESRFGKRLMYGGHVMSICRALAFDGFERSLGIVAINGGQHAAPTFGGDTLYAKSEIVDKVDVEGRSDVGLLRVRLVGIKEQNPALVDTPTYVTTDGKTKAHPNVVLTFDHWVVVPKTLA